MNSLERQKLIDNEELNDGYVPKLMDAVIRLPYVNSNKVDWTHGVVLEVTGYGENMEEARIATDAGVIVTEYCNYLVPLLIARADGDN